MAFIVERDNRATVNGKSAPARVYVTGPHFAANRDRALYGPGGGVFSSTTDPHRDDVLTFDREVDAERCVMRRSWSGVRIVEQATAPVLT